MNITVRQAGELTAAERAAWCDLQRTEPSLRSPYFRPEYVEAAAAVRADVRVAVLSRDGAPRGFFPYQQGRFGLARPVGGPLSDYQGLIAPADLAVDARALLRGAGLAAWDFDHLLAGQAAFSTWHTETAESPVIEIPETLDAWRAACKRSGSKIAEQTMRRWRKAERELGEIRFVEHAPDRALFDQVCAWKSAQYQRTGLVDVLSFPWTRDLLWRILQVDRPEFAGTLSALYCGDRLVAGHIGMRSATVWHWWFPSYDVELGGHSPGTLLLLEMIRAAGARGLREIDLGKGAATYKDRFKTGAVTIAEGTVAVPSLINTVRRGLLRSWEGLRSLPLPGFLRAPGRLVRRLARRGAFR